MSRAALANYVRRLSDDALNDLLVELPPGRFNVLLGAALATRRTAETVVPLAFQAAPPLAGEVARYRVFAERCAHGPLAELLELPSVWVETGQAVRLASNGLTGGSAERCWVACTCRARLPLHRRITVPCTCVSTPRYRRRLDAAAALAEALPATGARCRLLAHYTRRLSDDALNDLLVELPVVRFYALLDDAFTDAEPAANEAEAEPTGGVAA